MITRLRATAISLMFCCVFIAAPDAKDQRIDEFEKLYASGRGSPIINGELLVAEKGRVISRYRGGYADYSTRSPITLDAEFQLASTAKIFTAIAILQLRDANRLALDDSVVKYIPSFKWSSVTIKHLLTHTSGLPNLELYEDLIQSRPNHVVSSEDTISELAKWGAPLRFLAGERFAYSNTNYVLLATIVEKVSGVSFSDYLAKNVFTPAGMTQTYTVRDLAGVGSAKRVTNHARPLLFMLEPENVTRLQIKDPRLARRFRYELSNTGQTLGDQNVFSTLSDLLRFDQALYQGRLLKTTTLLESMTPTTLNDGSTAPESFLTAYLAKCSYGLGWEVCAGSGADRVVGHSGYNRGIHVMFYRNTTRQQTVIAYDNADGANFATKIASVVKVLNREAVPQIDWRESAVRVYGRALVSRSADEALLQYNVARLNSDHYADNKEELNRLGYDLLFNGYASLSLEPFKLNLIRHPDDDNLYDSYGDGLRALNQTKAAALAYQRALALNPMNDSARRSLQLLEGRVSP